MTTTAKPLNLKPLLVISVVPVDFASCLAIITLGRAFKVSALDGFPYRRPGAAFSLAVLCGFHGSNVTRAVLTRQVFFIRLLLQALTHFLFGITSKGVDNTTHRVRMDSDDGGTTHTRKTP